MKKKVSTLSLPPIVPQKRRTLRSSKSKLIDGEENELGNVHIENMAEPSFHKNVVRRIIADEMDDEVMERGLSNNEQVEVMHHETTHIESLNITPMSRSINPLDSPAARTRASIRRLVNQGTPNVVTQDEIGVEDNISNRNAPMDAPTDALTEEPKKRKKRGPTKMNAIGNEPHVKIELVFNSFGQLIGEESVKFSSFMGSLVREIVPVTLPDWRKLPTRLHEVLWRSIQMRCTNANDGWHKDYIFKKMGDLWRAGKSRLVAKVKLTSNEDELVKLKPDNIDSIDDWMDFVKEKKSARFLAKSEKFRSMKKKQLPHTSSRRGFARMAEDMKKKSSEPSSITRVMVWKKAHMKKDGNPVNSEAAKTLELIEKVGESLDNSLTNVTDDALSKVLGPDRSHVKGLGFGVTRSKLSMLSQKESRYTAIEDECHKLRSDVTEMKSIISSLLRNQGQTSEQNSNATESQPTVAHTNNPIMPSPLSGNNTSKKCKLVDWSGSGEVVAEGRWSSNDPTVLVHHVPLGPHAYRVWVDVVKKHDAFLWRPSSDISTMEEAIGTTIAWPADKVIMG